MRFVYLLITQNIIKTFISNKKLTDPNRLSILIRVNLLIVIIPIINIQIIQYNLLFDRMIIQLNTSNFRILTRIPTIERIKHIVSILISRFYFRISCL